MPLNPSIGCGYLRSSQCWLPHSVALLPIFVESWRITPTLENWFGGVMDYNCSSAVFFLNQRWSNFIDWSSSGAGLFVAVTLPNVLLASTGGRSNVRR